LLNFFECASDFATRIHRGVGLHRRGYTEQADSAERILHTVQLHRRGYTVEFDPTRREFADYPFEKGYIAESTLREGMHRGH
jgi:hypothetical protein